MPAPSARFTCPPPCAGPGRTPEMQKGKIMTRRATSKHEGVDASRHRLVENDVIAVEQDVLRTEQ